MSNYETALSETNERWRVHAMVLALGTFVVGTDAFVIAGLLPSISGSLNVGVGAAGQLVTVFSLAYAALTPVLATLTANWSRRSVLVVALVVFAAGNVVTAVAPDYWSALASRVVAAAGAGIYTASASAAAAALAGEERRGRAISIVMLGLTSSDQRLEVRLSSRMRANSRMGSSPHNPEPLGAHLRIARTLPGGAIIRKGSHRG